MKRTVLSILIIIFALPVFAQEHIPATIDYNFLRQSVNELRKINGIGPVHFTQELTALAIHQTTAMRKTYYGHDAVSLETKNKLADKMVDVDMSIYSLEENIAMIHESRVGDRIHPEPIFAQAFTMSSRHNASIMSPTAEAMGWDIQYDREKSSYLVTAYVLRRR